MRKVDTQQRARKTGLTSKKGMRVRIGRWIVAACALVLAGCATTRPTGEAPVRAVTDLSSDWRFHLGEPATDASRVDFDDRGWQAVDAPHSWNALGEYRIGRTDATRNVQGIGWYRKTIDAGQLPTRERHFLQFDGVGNIADVWVNGRHVTQHKGAFSRFRFDVTDQLTPGRNIVAVRADNSERKPGSSTQHVIPLLGDFFMHGGLYRGVSMVSAGAAHIALDDYGGPGVYARTTRIADDAATVEVLTRLTNAGDATDGIVTTRLIDADGRTAASASAPVTLGTGRSETRQTLDVARPRLWDGQRDPHPYRLVTELAIGGRTVDRVEDRFGIRQFRVDPDEGFFLNGRHLPLKGVSRHQDYLGKGWALTQEDHVRDMDLIEEMGANSVRFAHYQHAPEWFALNDERGMIVWAELAFVNKVAFDNSAAHPELVENARTQLVEQIRQHYNSPSVVTWGIGNEVDIDLAFNRLGPKADARPLLRELHALSKREDPGRLTVVADCCEDTPGDKAPYLPVLSGIADLMGYNRYYGWYYGAVDDLGPHLDALHAKHSDLPISVSEYGAGAALTQHADDPQGGPINFSGRPHPEAFQSWYHERHWPQITERRYLWGSWIWNMFDFSSTVRQEGDATDINDKGLVSFDRKTKKDAFFYYKANWSEAPVLHITGRRYVDRAYPVSDIRLYSNAASVRVSVNGRDLGTRPCPGRICVFERVALDAGANRIEARAEIGGKTLSDAIEWTAPDARTGLAINVGDLAGFIAADGTRYGSDAFVTGGTTRAIVGKDAEALSGAGERVALSGYRSGDFGYLLPLPAGNWRVTLLTVAPDRGARRSVVTADGRVVVERLGGGKLLSGSEARFNVRTDGKPLNLRFEGNAAIAAIRVAPLD